MDKSLFFIIFASNMKFNRCYLKRIVLLFLVALGIGNALYANNELKILADSLHKMIDAKPLFVQKKEQRIARIKCLLKDSGLTPDREYKVNLQLYNEYKKFNIDSAIHYVDRNLEIARQLNRNYLKYQSSLQLSLVYSMCGRYRDAELLLEKMKPSELPRSLLATYYDTYARFWEYYSISATIISTEKNGKLIRIHCMLLWIILPLTINCHGLILMQDAIQQRRSRFWMSC